MRRHLTYANVAATLALVFAMSGGALAAKHYLVSSTKQLSPKVLKAFEEKDKSVFKKLARTVVVTKATTAASAGTATNATNANTATNASNASNASNATNAGHAASADDSAKLGGVAPSAYLQRTAQHGQILSGQLGVVYPAKAGFVIAAASFPVPLPEGTPAPQVEFVASPTPNCPAVGKVTVSGVICVFGYNDENIKNVNESGGIGGVEQGANALVGFSVDVIPANGAEGAFLLATWTLRVP